MLRVAGISVPGKSCGTIIPGIRCPCKHTRVRVRVRVAHSCTRTRILVPTRNFCGCCYILHTRTRTRNLGKYPYPAYTNPTEHNLACWGFSLDESPKWPLGYSKGLQYSTGISHEKFLRMCTVCLSCSCFERGPSLID